MSTTHQRRQQSRQQQLPAGTRVNAPNRRGNVVSGVVMLSFATELPDVREYRVHLDDGGVVWVPGTQLTVITDFDFEVPLILNGEVMDPTLCAGAFFNMDAVAPPF